MNVFLAGATGVIRPHRRAPRRGWRGPRGSEEMHAAVASLEGQVTGAADLTGIVLRFGSFYGMGTFYEPGGSPAPGPST